jgi:DNA-binding winged helix-turn-helix (wHTH) protein
MDIDSKIYEWGEFEVDFSLQELRSPHEVKEIPNQIFDLLKCLFREHPQSTKQSQVMESLWNGSSDKDGSLKHLLFRLDKVLGDNPKQPRYTKRGNHLIKLVAKPKEIPKSRFLSEGDPDLALLLVRDSHEYEAIKSMQPQDHKLVTLHLKHRSMHYRRLEKALLSGQDILLLTVMSQSMTKWIRKLLIKAVEKGTRLRVLTWSETVPVVIEAFRKHIDENSARNTRHRTISQVIDAVADWTRLSKEFACVEVRKYKSVPTMQGFFVTGAEGWGIVELLPFATQPEKRPALILNSRTDSDVFRLFYDTFEDLWNRSLK